MLAISVTASTWSNVIARVSYGGKQGAVVMNQSIVLDRQTLMI